MTSQITFKSTSTLFLEDKIIIIIKSTDFVDFILIPFSIHDPSVLRLSKLIWFTTETLIGILVAESI